MIASITFSGSGSVASVPPRLAASREEALYDATLVRRFNAGDQSAFDEIISRHREKMFSVAFSLLRNRADAEEVAQDTFIRAYKALAQFRGEAALATWLHRITLNLSRNRYWYLFRRRQHATLSLDSALSDENQATLSSLIASDAPSPQAEMEAGEFSELVSRCMERLGPARRDVLTRRNLMNCSYGEIARTLGISVGTVKSRIARARETLREQLAKSCPEFAADVPPSEWLHPARSGAQTQLA